MESFNFDKFINLGLCIFHQSITENDTLWKYLHVHL